MKKIFLLLLFLFSSGFLIAHPASDIKVFFDQQKKILALNIMHSTPDVKKHYIDEVKVFLDKKQFIQQTCLSQHDKIQQVFKYILIDVEPGGTIQIETKCNIFGKKKIEFTVPNP